MSTSLIQRSAWLAWLLLLFSALGLIYMIGDTEPPFRVISSVANSPRAGELLRADAIVQRDLSRNCSVTFSRHILDSQGTRIDVQPLTYMPAAGLVQLEETSPGRLRMAVMLPAYVSPGPAKLVTPLAYTCNAWHSLRPIEVLMTVDFVVAP